jgi:hypothetical protein
VTAPARHLCQACNKQSGWGPVLRDDIWTVIVPERRGLMCLDCMRDRLGRELTVQDLEDCPHNAGWIEFALNGQVQPISHEQLVRASNADALRRVSAWRPKVAR